MREGGEESGEKGKEKKRKPSQVFFPSSPFLFGLSCRRRLAPSPSIPSNFFLCVHFFARERGRPRHHLLHYFDCAFNGRGMPEFIIPSMERGEKSWEYKAGGEGGRHGSQVAFHKKEEKKKASPFSLRACSTKGFGERSLQGYSCLLGRP